MLLQCVAAGLVLTLFKLCPIPSWPNAQVDSKKELEKLLRATCEAFIMAVTKLAVDPMLSFITKVTAVKVAASSAGRGKPLREQVNVLTSPRYTCCVVRLPDFCSGSHQSQPCLHAEWRWSLGTPAVQVIFAAPTFMYSTAITCRLSLQGASA